VVGVPFAVEDFPPVPEGAGVLSLLGVVEDYHVTVKALLKKLVDKLHVHVSFTHKILVDSPTLDERALAVRAGLGFIGRNGLVISPEYGSRFNIGVLLTDLPLAQPPALWATPFQGRGLSMQTPYPEAELSDKQSPLPGKGAGGETWVHTNTCPPNCQKCIDACPSRALSASGSPDPSRCISYLTQKDNLTPDEAMLIGRHLYGCDICQNVCPFNLSAPTPWANPDNWLSMSDADFTKAYGHTAMLWRGTALLRRNAAIVKENVRDNGLHPTPPTCIK